MWPFSSRREERKKKGNMEKIVTGIIIGGAIGSIIGKKLLDHDEDEDDDTDSAEFEDEEEEDEEL